VVPGPRVLERLGLVLGCSTGFGAAVGEDAAVFVRSRCGIGLERRSHSLEGR
jgi:hypothetical protein